MMFVNVSPAEDNCDETNNSLTFVRTQPPACPRAAMVLNKAAWVAGDAMPRDGAG